MHTQSNWQQWWVCFWIRIHKDHVDNQWGLPRLLEIVVGNERIWVTVAINGANY